MKIYVFGNPLVETDKSALVLSRVLARQFPEIEFCVEDPNANFPPGGERDLLILDVVRGIPEVALLDFSDLAAVEKSPVSPHDYDLLLHLLLLKKMDKIGNVRIIGIPYGMKGESALGEVTGIIRGLL